MPCSASWRAASQGYIACSDRFNTTAQPGPDGLQPASPERNGGTADGPAPPQPFAAGSRFRNAHHPFGEPQVIARELAIIPYRLYVTPGFFPSRHSLLFPAT